MTTRRFASMMMMIALSAMGGSARAVDAGQAAPEVQLRDLAGNELKLSSFKGKVVLLDFWASWCAPCRESMPVLEKLSKTYKEQGLVVLGVNIDDDSKKAAQFLKDVPVSFNVVVDPKKTAAKAYAPPTMPSSYVIDRQGKIHAVHAGFKAADGRALESEIQKLLR